MHGCSLGCTFSGARNDPAAGHNGPRPAGQHADKARRVQRVESIPIEQAAPTLRLVNSRLKDVRSGLVLPDLEPQAGPPALRWPTQPVRLVGWRGLSGDDVVQLLVGDAEADEQLACSFELGVHAAGIHLLPKVTQEGQRALDAVRS